MIRIPYALLALTLLAGCVQSEKPLLTDAKPMLGGTVRMQLFSREGGEAREAEQVTFRWDGERYRPIGKRPKGINAFSVHTFEGRSLIVQSPASDAKVEYAVARRLVDGVYLVNVIDEDDANAADRSRFCGGAPATCKIATPEALFVFARATADKSGDKGGLAMVLAPPKHR
jgi:hypothetical protein